MKPEPALEAAYLSTDYCVDDAPDGPFAIRIGESCVEMAKLVKDGEFNWAFLTACNPGSTRLSEAENPERMNELESIVQKRGWRYFHGRGVGRIGDWPAEPSLLIIGIQEVDAIELGRRFGQNAIVAGWADAFGRLVWIAQPACTTAGMIEARDVSKSFGPNRVLNHVSLAVSRGEVVVLLGPSGGGKSTLLRVLNGLIWPEIGDVAIAGERLTPTNARQLRHRMGYVVQDAGLFPHLTAAGNVSLLAQHLGWDRERIRNRLKELTDIARLPTDALDRYPAELSGGQRQRVGLMRALMLDPAVLLMDEPLGALDPITRSQLQADLRTIFRELQKTVVLVTHDMAEAAFFADEIVLLAGGQIVQRGTMREFVRQPATQFVADFVRAQREPLEALREAGA
jgi:osmoprotectant transport system ATP-binding protein